MIDLASLTEQVYQQVAADAAILAFLPAGADAIFPNVEDLRVEGLLIEALPARPWLALRRGAAPQLDRVVTAPLYTWYCYDDPTIGYGRLEHLPKLIADAYESGLTLSTVAVGAIEVAAGAQTRDSRLGLLQLVTVAIGAV